ncbi:MAG: peptidase BlaR1 [Deltaproteobacteria bacterium]|nr:peptidase BlaR1 [Deltaproteobacteria bacterium]
MRHARIPLALALWTVAAVAGAQLSREYADWPDTPAGFLLTKAERKAYEQIKSDVEAKAFIELFWAKRDPDLNTPLNEFKAAFDLRVEAADKAFTFGQTKGSLSDRGRVLILLGKYSQRQTYRPGELAALTGERSGRGDDSGANEVWKYQKSLLPAGFKSDEVTFVFTESNVGYADFILDRTDRRNAGAIKLLAAVQEALVLNPKITEAPRLGMLPGSKMATAQQLSVLDAQPRPWPEGSVVRGYAGTLSESIHPLWLYVQLPASVPQATQAIGRVANAASGEMTGSFVVAAKPFTAAGGNGYEFAFPVEPGAWKIDVALVNDTGPLAVAAYEGTVDAVPKEGTYLSPMYWGVDIRQEVQARLGDPLNIGGWHVVPRVDDTYSPREQLSYFCFVLRPGVPPAPAAADPASPAPAAKPKLEVSMALYLGGQKVTEVPAMPVNVSNISGELWMFGNGLPLEGFRKAGEYRLDVTLRDTVTDVSRTTAIPVRIPEQPAAPPPTGS